MANPPAGVLVFDEHFTCNAERVCLAFELVLEGVDELLKDKGLRCFLMDFTFCTCREGLLLGAIGPVGLHVTSKGPKMLLLDLFLEKSQKLDLSWSDGFFDCSNYQTVLNAVKEYDMDLRVHRCLQHAPVPAKALITCAVHRVLVGESSMSMLYSHDSRTELARNHRLTRDKHVEYCLTFLNFYDNVTLTLLTRSNPLATEATRWPEPISDVFPQYPLLLGFGV